jgi:hypothetical protein
MALITCADLHAEVAAWHAREAAEQLPLAVSLRALDALREALPDMSPSEWTELRDEMERDAQARDDDGEQQQAAFHEGWEAQSMEVERLRVNLDIAVSGLRLICEDGNDEADITLRQMGLTDGRPILGVDLGSREGAVVTGGAMR